ncbi:MAG: hypothetical protein V1694_01510 [Candidatus Eisenbacteria bacterium]
MMAGDTRRLLEDLALAKTALDTDEIKDELTHLRQALEEEQRKQELERDEKQRSEKGQKFFTLGEESFRSAKWTEAIVNYEIAARSFPGTYYFTSSGIFSSKLALFEIARCLQRLGRYSESLKVFDELSASKDNLATDCDYLDLFMKQFNPEFVLACEGRLEQLEQGSSAEADSHSERKDLMVRVFELAPDTHPEYEEAFREQRENEKKQAETRRALLRAKMAERVAHRKPWTRARVAGFLLAFACLIGFASVSSGTTDLSISMYNMFGNGFWLLLLLGMVAWYFVRRQGKEIRRIEAEIKTLSSLIASIDSVLDRQRKPQ